MKHSIRKKFTLIFITVVVLTLGACMILNMFLLKNYYISIKKQNMISTYEKINRMFSSNMSDEEKFQSLHKISERYNISLGILDTSWNVIFTSRWDDPDNLRNELQMIWFSGGGVQKGSKYEIWQGSIPPENGYLVCLGILDSGEMYIMRTTIVSISETAEISNRFFLFVGFTCIIFGGIVIFFITKNLTKPIIELSGISKRISMLDFDAKYEGPEDDEIGELGKNINLLSKRLEHTITDLKKANIDLKKDIEEKIKIDEMRKDFISSVSHELKTPISIIGGYAEGLIDNVADDEETRKMYISVIIDETEKMDKLVKNLLALSRLESGDSSLQIERFRLDEMVKGVVSSAEILFEQNGITYESDIKGPLHVWGSPFEIEEAVSNYISNAVHYCDGRKIIRTQVRENGNLIRFEVFNTGSSIPEEEQEKIWQKFYKVDKARTRQYGGSGIGLSIVKAIMESHGRQCGVYNTQDGVTFWLELERAAVPTENE